MASLSWLLLTWWRHQIETFSALLAICAGNSPVTDEFPAQRPVTRSFGAFFDLRMNKRWVGEAGDLRRHRAHHDVTVMDLATQAGRASATMTLNWFSREQDLARIEEDEDLREFDLVPLDNNGLKKKLNLSAFVSSVLAVLFMKCKNKCKIKESLYKHLFSKTIRKLFLLWIHLTFRVLKRIQWSWNSQKCSLNCV